MRHCGIIKEAGEKIKGKTGPEKNGDGEYFLFLRGRPHLWGKNNGDNRLFIGPAFSAFFLGAWA